jgi:hypothetical protein
MGALGGHRVHGGYSYRLGNIKGLSINVKLQISKDLETQGMHMAMEKQNLDRLVFSMTYLGTDATGTVC